MKRFLQLIVVLFYSLTLPAQAVIKVIKLGESRETFELKFPIIELSNKQASQKINDYLQTNLLEQTTLKNPGTKVFNKRKWTDSTSGMDQSEFEILVNNHKILSLSFFYEGLGAYPSPNWNYYQFNSQNGEVILIEDVISAPGLSFLDKDLKQKRRALIEKHVAELKRAKDKETRDEAASVKEELTSCNEDAELNNFSITKTGLNFHLYPCLPHVIQNLDEGLDVSYSFAQLREKLTSFGKKIFSNLATDIRKDFFPSLLKPLTGHIEKYNIVMQLTIDKDSSVNGFYYYQNQGIAIELSGKIKNSRIELLETDNQGNLKAKFAGIISGTSINGTWTDMKKLLAFEVGYKRE